MEGGNLLSILLRDNEKLQIVYLVWQRLPEEHHLMWQGVKRFKSLCKLHRVKFKRKILLLTRPRRGSAFPYSSCFFFIIASGPADSSSSRPKYFGLLLNYYTCHVGCWLLFSLKAKCFKKVCVPKRSASGWCCDKYSHFTSASFPILLTAMPEWK